MFSVSLFRTTAVDPGFHPSNLLTMKLSLPPTKYTETQQLTNVTHAMLNRIAALPGVSAAATITNLPLEAGPDLPFVREGQPGDSDTSAKYRVASPAYFRTVQVGLRTGRFFTDMDRENTTPVVIINDAMARQYWPNQNPIGQRIIIGKDMGPQFSDQPRLVIGVVGSIREDGLDRGAPPEMFIPDRQAPGPLMALLVRNLPIAVVIKTKVTPQRLIHAVQQAVWSVDPQQPLWQVRTMEQVMNAWMAPRKFQVFALCAFAALGLVLSGLGIYSVVSCAVSQRTRELGIRMAIGARPPDIGLLVLRQALQPVLMGILIGLVITLILGRGIASFCYGVADRDPKMLASISLTLILIAIAAVIVPARKAITIDPVVALRHE
jgi:predicted permease